MEHTTKHDAWNYIIQASDLNKLRTQHVLGINTPRVIDMHVLAQFPISWGSTNLHVAFIDDPRKFTEMSMWFDNIKLKILPVSLYTDLSTRKVMMTCLACLDLAYDHLTASEIRKRTLKTIYGNKVIRP